MQWNEQLGISRETFEKSDSFLRQTIAEAKGDMSRELPVMIVVESGRSPEPGRNSAEKKDRAKLATEQAAAFENEIADLLKLLTGLGAKDIQRFWINRTISALIPLGALDAIGRRPDVKQIMLLRKVQAIN